MLRTQISLTERERATLDAVSANTGRSISALIRDAVDATYADGGDAEADLAAMRAARGAWAERDVDAAAWVDRLRSGSRSGLAR